MLAALRSAVHVHLGFGGFSEYMERLFGYKPRTTREKLRVAEALEGLPGLADALSRGALSWCAVRELVRVAVAQTENSWLEVARGKPLRQLEELVAGKVPGDEPNAPCRPEARRHVLRFEVCADTYATFREAVAALRRGAGASLDDDATLLALARHVLGGPRDAGRSSYQVVLRVCPECESGEQLGDGQLVPVDSEIVEMARCDAQEVPVLAANDAHGAAHDPSALSLRSAPAANDVNACAAAHVGHPVPRAKQQIPPATRRAVLSRDQHRCRVPGCKNTTFLDLHHVVPRSEGGGNHAENILTLCGVHHRAVHHGVLVIVRGSDGQVRYEHADGGSYGELADPVVLDVEAQVFAGLCGLGFRVREVRVVLAELRARSADSMLSAEQLLREALLELTPDRAQGRAGWPGPEVNRASRPPPAGRSSPYRNLCPATQLQCRS